MGTGDILGVEPQVPRLRDLERDGVILSVVPSHENDASGRGSHFAGIRRFCRKACFLWRRYVSGLRQFMRYLQQFLIGSGFSQLQLQTIDIVDFIPALS